MENFFEIRYAQEVLSDRRREAEAMRRAARSVKGEFDSEPETPCCEDRSRVRPNLFRHPLFSFSSIFGKVH